MLIVYWLILSMPLQLVEHVIQALTYTMELDVPWQGRAVQNWAVHALQPAPSIETLARNAFRIVVVALDGIAARRALYCALIKSLLCFALNVTAFLRNSSRDIISSDWDRELGELLSSTRGKRGVPMLSLFINRLSVCRPWCACIS